MRKFKFRAWDNGQMVTSFFPESNYQLEVSFGTKLRLFHCAGRSEVTYEDGEKILLPYWVCVEDAVIMQYIGLKDMNGKEIYEGDILLDVSPYAGNPKYQVFWGKDDYAWLLKNENDHWSRIADDERYYEKLKVIGNIYENPELMEG